MKASRRTLLTVSAIYQTSTARAVCVRDLEDGPDIWLPRSEVTLDRDHLFDAAHPHQAGIGTLFDGAPPTRGDAVSVTAPEWLLAEKGLL